ncbi:MAG: hypothetical protein ACI88A_003743 [Paraglaciecola sp.]
MEDIQNSKYFCAIVKRIHTVIYIGTKKIGLKQLFAQKREEWRVHMRNKNTNIRTLLPLALALSAGYGHAATFTNVAETAGLTGEFYEGQSFHVLGINWIDYNNDTFPDMFVSNGKGLAAHLYRNNNGNGTFTRVDSLLPTMPDIEMGGSVFADYDNDGDSDIYIFATNESLSLSSPNPPDGASNLLLKNMWMENGGMQLPGQPLFVDVAAAAGVTGDLPVPLGPDYPAQRSMTGGWLDFDNDGCVDLYVGNMVLSVTNDGGNVGGNPANRDVLYKNNCDGTFTDVTATAVNDGTDEKQDRPALAFIGAHLNNDAFPDMYVANVHEAPPYSFDLVYINNGDGTFTQVAHPLEDITSVEDDMEGAPPEQNIGDDAQSAMGIDVADIDRDGNWDIYISDVAMTVNDEQPFRNPLYLGLGNDTWTDNVAEDAGVPGHFSWGVTFLDVDHNGYEDLFVGSNGLGTVKFMYMNNGDGTFTNANDDPENDGTGTSGFVNAPLTRGTATADFDQDGDLDLAIINQEGTIELYRNDTADQGHWIQVRLKAAISNGSAIGAKINLRTPEGRQMRQVKGGSSTHSQNEMITHFGLNTITEVQQIRVSWPSGVQDTLVNIAADQVVTIIEGGDTDGDGVSDLIDNCINIPNADQADSDNNGVGDACENALPAPEVLSVVPGAIAQGATVVATVTGTGFQTGATVAILPNAGGVTINSLTVDSDTQISMEISVAIDATVAIKSVEITNPDGQSASIRRGFRVTAP